MRRRVRSVKRKPARKRDPVTRKVLGYEPAEVRAWFDPWERGERRILGEQEIRDARLN